MSNDKYYVLVIGAGLSGLTCAQELQDKNIKVDIVEASDRIGGRIMSNKQFCDEPIELGAEAIQTQNTPFISYLTSLGVQFTQSKESASHIYDRNKERMMTKKEFFERYPEVYKAHNSLAKYYQDIEPRVSVKDYFFNEYKEFGHYFDTVIGAEYASSTEHLGAQGVGELESYQPETVSYSIKNMNLNQVLKLAFSDVFDRVSLNQQVTKVVVFENGVDVEMLSNSITRKKERYDFVVCSVPLSQLRKINWSPELSREKLQIIGKTIKMQKGGKIFIKLDRSIVGVSENSASTLIFDLMPTVNYWHSSTEKKHMITGLVTGKAYDYIHIYGLQNYIRHLEKALQEQTDSDVTIKDYEFKDWGEVPFIEGLYSSPGIGYQTYMRSVLAANIKERVYFCGEAYHRTNPGTLHGAYETGVNAAQQIRKKIDLP